MTFNVLHDDDIDNDDGFICRMGLCISLRPTLVLSNAVYLHVLADLSGGFDSWRASGFVDHVSLLLVLEDSTSLEHDLIFPKGAIYVGSVDRAQRLYC